MRPSSLVGHTRELLGIILHSKKPADVLIDTFFRSHKYLGSHDRKFISEKTYGTLRYLRRCEILVAAITEEIHEEAGEEDKLLLMIAAYACLYEKHREITPEDISVKLRSTRFQENIEHIFSFFSNPMPETSDSLVTRIGVEYSFPDWMVRKFIEQYGDVEAEKICASLNEIAPITLRVNTLKATVEQCQEELKKQGIETTRTSLSPIGLHLSRRINVFSVPAFQEGWFEVQDEGSQMLPLFIDPKPNVKLLDVCAGAGGKTLEFAALMKNRGEIFATDINSFRLEELRKRTKRAGVQNVRIQHLESIEDLHERTGHFDFVFVDAPCSGLGTIRRNPGMKWMVTEQTITEVSEKQRAILQASAPLVKPGGRLVYATCTLLKQENEDMVEDFLTRHPEFRKIDVEELLVKWNIGLHADHASIKLLPQLHGTDGFFCAVLEKQTVR